MTLDTGLVYTVALLPLQLLHSFWVAGMSWIEWPKKKRKKEPQD